MKLRIFIQKNKLILLVLLAVMLYMPVTEYRAVHKQVAMEEPQQLEEIDHQLSRYLQPALTDMVALSAHPAARAYLEEGDNLQEFSELLWQMIAEEPGFDQIRYLDETGREIIRYDRKPGWGVVPIPPEKLQDKSDRYYFQDTVHGEPGMVYLSPFDLNMENGVIERPLKPMIRVATPLRNLAGEERGILIINLLGQPLLDMVSTMETPHRQYMLLNPEGYYLAGGPPDHQWGFMHAVGRDWHLGFDNPEVWLRLQGRRHCQFLLNWRMHTARKVQIASLLVSSRPEEGNPPRVPTRMTPHDGYHWILVSSLGHRAVLEAYVPRFLFLLKAGLPLMALFLLVLWRRTMTGMALEKLEKEQHLTTLELADSRKQVSTLEGLLPICSACSKVRDDDGYWSGVADYLTRHGGVQFTHGVCQDCLEELYGDLYENDELAALGHRSHPIGVSDHETVP